MVNLKCKLLGHDIQCMTPMGAEYEAWGCVRCEYEADWMNWIDDPGWDVTRLQKMIWGFRRALVKLKSGDFSIFGKVQITEEDDIPF